MPDGCCGRRSTLILVPEALKSFLCCPDFWWPITTGMQTFAYDLKSSFKYMWSKLQKFYVLHMLTFLVVLCHMERHGFKYPDGVHGFIRDVFLNVTLLKSWYDPAEFTFNGVTWFLSCILFIYFCVPYIIHFFKSKKWRGTALLSFLILFMLTMTFDTMGYKMGMNP